MKTRSVKLLALLIAIILIVSSLPIFATAADDLQYNYSKEYNSGKRGEVCTTLNGTSASSYYTGSYTYENLITLSSSSLKTSLHNLMTDTHTYTSSYADCRDMAIRTDCENGRGNASGQDNQKVTLIYTSYEATRSQYNGWNREHVWPQSLGGGNTSGGGADLHHIRPSDAGVNSSRGNKPYGYAGSGATAKYGSNPATGVLGGTYNSTYFEPNDDTKGDVARIVLYVYVRWGSAWGADSVTEVFQSVDVLLEWCALDPVDTWEMGRNEVVQKIQGNRNIFIDYPELAWELFDKEAPEKMTTPSRGDMGDTPPSISGGNNGGGTTNPDNNETTTTQKPSDPTEQEPNKPSSSAGLLAEFDFGANGDANHVDGNSIGTSKTYTTSGYTLPLSSMSNIYGPAYDAKGNSCIKMGASSKAGSLTFTVPSDVDKVVIYAAKYKANASKITINGTEKSLTKNSNDGQYDMIEIDTTSTKTITINTLSGGYRCMINTIEFWSNKTEVETETQPPEINTEETETTAPTVEPEETETETKAPTVEPEETETETKAPTVEPEVSETETKATTVEPTETEIADTTTEVEATTPEVESTTPEVETDTQDGNNGSTEIETNAPGGGNTPDGSDAPNETNGTEPNESAPADESNPPVVETDPAPEVNTEPAKKKGCKSSVTCSMAVVCVSLVGLYTVIRRKKED